MDLEAIRRWASWKDDIREWSRREDFRAMLPALLVGEDDAFMQYMNGIVGAELPSAA